MDGNPKMFTMYSLNKTRRNGSVRVEFLGLMLGVVTELMDKASLMLPYHLFIRER